MTVIFHNSILTLKIVTFIKYSLSWLDRFWKPHLSTILHNVSKKLRFTLISRSTVSSTCIFTKMKYIYIDERTSSENTSSLGVDFCRVRNKEKSLTWSSSTTKKITAILNVTESVAKNPYFCRPKKTIT